MHLLTFKHPINDVHDTLKLRQYASLRTPMKYVKKPLWWKKNNNLEKKSKACENYYLSYNLKSHIDSIRKSFVWHTLMGYLKKTSFSWEEDWIEDSPKRQDCRLKSEVSTLLSKSYTWELNVWCDSTLTCILDQLPSQISEIQAFAACHVELIYCRRSAYLVDNFVHIKEISVYYPSLNRTALPKKSKDSLKVYIFFSSICKCVHC